MEWVNLAGGLALYVNGNVVGWVTKTLNGHYLYGVVNQHSVMKECTTFDDAKVKLEKVFI